MKKTLFLSILVMLISFAAKAQDTYLYYDENDVEKSQIATLINSDNQFTTLQEGWYIVYGWRKFDEQPLTISGDVYLIFGESGTLELDEGLIIPTGSSLTIYNYSSLYGLRVSSSDGVAIDVQGTLNASHVDISASGADGYRDINVAGTLTLQNSGNRALELNSGINASGTINFTGYKVSGASAIVGGANATINISGGTVELSKIEANQLTLDWNTPEDYCEVQTYNLNTLSIPDGKIFVVDGTTLNGDITNADVIEVLNGKKITPPAYPFTPSPGVNFPNVITGLEYTGEPLDVLASPDTYIDIDDGKAELWYKVDNGEWTQTPTAKSLGNHEIYYKVVSKDAKYVDYEPTNYIYETEISALGSFEVDYLKYVVIDDSEDNPCVEIVGYNNSQYYVLSSVNIRNTVEYNEKTYKVTRIGDNALKDNVDLVQLKFNEGCNVTYIGESAFNNTHALKYLDGFEYCTKLTTIGNSAFVSSMSDDGDVSITIPASVVTIGKEAFQNCAYLKGLSFAPNSKLKTIGESAFNNCSLYGDVEFPASLETIGHQAFGGLQNDGPLNITFESGSKLKEIGSYAFYWSYNLQSIELPNNNIKIGASAFHGSHIKSLTIPSSITNIGGNAFSNNSEMLSAEIQSPITAIPMAAFQSCNNLTSFTIPSTVTEIGASAFDGTGLKKITIPAGVTSIGNRAFNGICELEITFESLNPPTLGSDIFTESWSGCTSPKLSLKLSQCANLTAFQEAFRAYISDASNISGGASFPESNPDLPPFNKDYDGTSVMTCNPAVEVTDDNGNIFTITAVTFWDNHGEADPTPGTFKDVRVKYNLKLASETDNCIEGAEVKLESRGTISTGTTLILKNNTENHVFTIPGINYEQSFWDLYGSEYQYISITYNDNDGTYQARVEDAAPAGVYHFFNTDTYINVTINVNRPYTIYQGETITLPGLTDLDKLSATDAAGNLVFGLKDPNNTSDLTYTLTATPTAATGDKTLEIKQNGVALCTIDVTVKEAHFKMQYTSTSDAEETKYFSSLADASTFVNASTDIDKTKPITATLLNDYAGGDDEQSFRVDGGCTWILDLNTENPTTKKPYSMTGKCEFTIDNGNLTINADNEQTQLYAVFKSSTQNNPSLTINGGKYMSYTGDGIVSLSKAKAYINDGVFIDEYNGTGVCCVIIGEYCDITITKGIFRSLAMAIKVSYQRVPIVPITSKYYKITDDGEVEIANPDYSYYHLLDGDVLDDEGDIVDNPIKNLAIHKPYDAYAALTDEPDPNDATKTIKTLTFRYDEHKGDDATVPTYNLTTRTTSGKFPAWYLDNNYKVVESVVFDESFKKYYPTLCYQWFYGMNKLSSITGLENLNTGKATGMAYMFSQCESLKSIDLSNFNTASVTEDDKDEPLALAGMFSGCLNLETIILGADFKPTANTKSLASMFSTCQKLATIKVAANTNWNLDQIEDGESMFSTCYNIIGNDGTKLYPTGESTAVGATDKTRAHVDEGGLFTTGDYVVLYDLNDENATIKNNKTVDNFTAGLTLPTATDVKNPGHTFKGWYRIDNGGDYYETDVNDEPVKSTEISANEIGNRIYRAEWELNYYTITFPTDVTNIGDAPYTNVADPTDPNIGKYAYDGTIKLNVTEGSYIYTYTDGDNKSQTVKIPTAGDDAYTFHVPPALAGSEITVVLSPFMVEGTFYSTFAEAVLGSRSIYYGGGKTIVQLMDYTVPETEAIEFMANQTLDVGIYKLDLGAKTLATYNSGEITIQGSTANGKTGTITSSNQTIKSECSKLYLKNVIIQTSNTCSDEQNGLAVIDGVSDSHKIYLYAGTKIEGTQSGAYIYPMASGSVYLDEYAEAYSNGKLVLYAESGYGGKIIVGAEWGDDGRLPTSLDVRKAENFKATFKYSADGDEITKILPNFMQAVTEANYKDAGGNYPSSVTITMLKGFKRTAGYFGPYGRTPIEISHINFNINFDEAFSDTCMIKVSGQKTLSVTGGADTKAYFQFEVGSGATLNLTGGTYDFYTDVIKIETNGTVTLNGVTFEGTSFGGDGSSPQNAYSDGLMLDNYPAFIDNNGGKLIITNGTYQYASEDDESPVVINRSAPVAGYGVYTKAGETTINGGAFYGAVKQLNTSEPELDENGNQMVDEDGDPIYKKEYKFFYPAYLEGGTTTITGGTFSGDKYGLYVPSGNTTAQKLQGGTYVGGTAAIYNEGGAALLTDGYAFYTSAGTKDTMLYYTGTNGGYVFEKYDENSKLLLTKDGSTDPITSVTVKAIVPVANPSKFELGKGAKYAFDIIGGAANTTYTFTSATEDVSDGETTTKETAVKVTYESGKYYVQTTAYAKVGETYTLTSNENEKVEIKVTMMDYAAGLFDDDWHKSPFTVATGNYKLYKEGGFTEYTSNGTQYSFSTEGSNGVWFKKTDGNSNTIQETSHSVKIDDTAPFIATVTYGTNTEITCGTPDEHTAITLPTGTEITISAKDFASGVKSIWTDASTEISGTNITYNEGNSCYNATQTLTGAGTTYYWTIKATDHAVADGNTTEDGDACYIDITAKNEVALTVSFPNFTYGSTTTFKVTKPGANTGDEPVDVTAYCKGTITASTLDNPVVITSATPDLEKLKTLNVGTYDLEVEYATTGTNAEMGTKKVGFEVGKATPTVAAVADLVYDGSEHALVTREPDAATGLTFLYRIETTNYTDIPSATNAGKYTVYYTVASTNGNYKSVSETSEVVTIAPYKLTPPATFADIKNAADNSLVVSAFKTYDGTSTADVQPGFTLTGVGTESVPVTLTADFAVSDDNGINTVSDVSGEDVTYGMLVTFKLGDDVTNYTFEKTVADNEGNTTTTYVKEITKFYSADDVQGKIKTAYFTAKYTVVENETSTEVTKNFSTLADAIGYTYPVSDVNITLEDNYVVSETDLPFDKNVNFTLDLKTKGKTMTMPNNSTGLKFSITTGALTINGDNTKTNLIANFSVKGASLVINGGKYKGDGVNNCIVAEGRGSVEITDGTFDGNGYDCAYFFEYGTKGTISGGTFTTTCNGNPSIICAVEISAPDLNGNSAVLISGGTFSVIGDCGGAAIINRYMYDVPRVLKDGYSYYDAGDNVIAEYYYNNLLSNESTNEPYKSVSVKELAPHTITLPNDKWTATDANDATNTSITKAIYGTTVTVTYSGSKTVKEVKVYPMPKSITINTPESTSLSAGETLTLTATISPTTIADEDNVVTWTSSDDNVATVSEKTGVATVSEKTGVVTGVSAGEVTITATTTNGKTAEITLTVQ